MGTYFIHGKYAIYEILCLNGVVLAIQVDSNKKKIYTSMLTRQERWEENKTIATE